MSDQLDGSPVKPPRGASGVSAADKYAELEARGEERPRCECHGEAMYWHSGGRKRRDRWSCSVNANKWSARWREENIEKARESVRAANARQRVNHPEKIREQGRVRSARHNANNPGRNTRYARAFLNRSDQAKYDALAAQHPEIAALLNQTGGNE